MINNRLERILRDTEQLLEISLTLKDQAGVLVDQNGAAIFSRRSSHPNWFCPWKRADNPKWRTFCISNCNLKIPAKARQQTEPFISECCWKGLQEVIVPVHSSAGLAFIIYAGVFRSQICTSDFTKQFAGTEYQLRYRQLPTLSEENFMRISGMLQLIGKGMLHELQHEQSYSSGKKGIIERFISDNCQQKIYLADLAKELHFSASRASHFIREQTGKSFSQLLLEQRLQRARNLLITSSMALAEIATRTGFSNEYYMSRQFRKMYGCPPHKYRLEHKKQPD